MHIHDKPEIERQQIATARRLVKLAVRRNGGNWPCPGKCGRRISANKNSCLACSEKVAA